MYNQHYSEIYDLLHADKAYDTEVKFIYDIYDRYAEIPLLKILDIGCGTGNHLEHFANESISILGVDPSKEMIAIARKKKLKNVRFMIGNISQLSIIESYEMAISLFNVVNHINNLSQLKQFFRAIYYRVKPGGVFVFDCFNGIAAIRDAPQDREIEKEIKGKFIKITTKCDNDLFNSEFTMYNKMEVDNKEIEYSLKQTLWQPKILKDLLSDIGFDVCSVYKAFDIEQTANLDDYKIVFVSKKKGV
jgi:SAM-dependent methyltransferase